MKPPDVLRLHKNKASMENLYWTKLNILIWIIPKEGYLVRHGKRVTAMDAVDGVFRVILLAAHLGR